MNAFVLRAFAALVAAATFVGANAYVLGHPKNPAAPLQPPASDDLTLVQPTASAKPTPSTSGKPTATPRSTPTPRITLQPGVRTTALPGITYTHVS